MKKNKLNKLILLATIFTSISILGCNAAKEGVNDAKNTVEKATEDVKKGTEDMVNKFTEEETKYDKSAFIKDLEAKGFEPKSDGTIKDDKYKVTSIDGEMLKIKGGELRVYEYKTDQKESLNSDINSIQENGYNINGNKIEWKVSPHFYRKGRVVVIYDGDSQDVMKVLSEILGSPFIG
ncbi:hypothetical protein [Clostridium sp.]|uniref:hypothetical protein n=1 Tax=Clostridium sp. TaxID=1506 RepID=UPI002FCC87BE